MRGFRSLLGSSLCSLVAMAACQADVPSVGPVDATVNSGAVAPAERTAERTRAGPPDSAIRNTVQDEILFDRTMSLDTVAVRIENGRVTLTGTTDSLLAKERAARIAATVKGVRAVRNELRVRPAPGMTAGKIETAIEQSLRENPATEPRDIGVQATEDGSVVLSGTVQSWAERFVAGKLARGVRGVTAVENRLQVAPQPERSDSEILAEVKERLRWNALVDDAALHVSVSDGVVRLSGSVASLAEKEKAAELAWVAGVEQVNAAKLDVIPFGSTQPRRSLQVIGDEALERAILSSLAYPPELRDLEATVEVNPDRAYSDNTIEARVRGGLLRDPLLESEEIAVAVVGGVAHLTGTVETAREKARADDAAAAVAGVTAIDNDLRIDREGARYVPDEYLGEQPASVYDWHAPTPRYSEYGDEVLQERVRREIWWSPYVDAEDVTVAVENGVATLSGSVDSFRESSVAVSNAYEAGATAVRNELAIRRAAGGPPASTPTE